MHNVGRRKMFRNCKERPDIVCIVSTGYACGGLTASKCGECGSEIYRGESAYSWIGRRGQEIFVCESCFCELFDELDMQEKAALIGSERIIIGETG